MKWVKTKDGGAKSDTGFAVVPDKDDTWRLEKGGKVLFRGDREACKAKAGKTDPQASFAGTIGKTKKKTETGGEWLLRLAKEQGAHPGHLLAFPQVCKDAGIDPADYSEEDVKTLVREAFPLAQEWAKSQPNVDVTYNSWFGVSGTKVNEADKKFLAALDAQNKADVPAEAKATTKAKAASAPKEPAGKDAFGFRLGSGAAQINTGLAADWKTAEQIAKDSKAPRAVHGHLKKLVELGVLEEQGEGKARQFRIKPAAPAKKKTAKA